MKLENNNKEVIKRITNSSIKFNKGRNTLVVLAIVLTTFMISSVFSIGTSFIKNYKTMLVRVEGSTASIYLSNPKEDQIKAIENLGISRFIGKEITAGQINTKDKDNEKSTVFLKYYDKENWQNQIKPAIGELKGNYPTKENEVMISQKALDLLGRENAKIGDEIKVSYIDDKGSEIRKDFVLSGTYRNYELKFNTGYILLSEKFIKNNDLNLLDNGMISFTVKNSKKNEVEELLDSKIKLDENQSYQLNFDTSSDYKEMAIYSIATMGIIGLFIVFSGYLLIYNIMYIAVTKDIQFYGLMKTIGASPKQIKKIVKGQVFRLSIIGIPIGLIIGGVVSFNLIPMALGRFSSKSSLMPSDISFNPLIFIGATLFSLLTISLSCRKPAKIASIISPTEALRYSGSKQNKKKKDRKSTNGGKLYKMAWYNVFRDKKRAILVFLSLFIGITTYLSVSTYLDCMGIESYVNRYTRNDFEIQNRKAIDGKIDYKLIKEIKNIDGVKSVSNFKFSNLQSDTNQIPDPSAQYTEDKFEELDKLTKLEEEIEKAQSTSVSPLILGVDDLAIESFNDKNNVKIDVEAFKTGKLALIDNYWFGKKVKNKNSNTKTINLKGKHDNSLVLDGTQFTNDSNLLPDVGLPTVYISLSQLEKLDKNAVNYGLYINVDKKYDEDINSKLKEKVKSKNLLMLSRSERINELKDDLTVTYIIGGGISIILIFIGLLNFINVMVTGVNIRLKELAVMESIGMTKKQIKKMLTFEGFYYAGITSLLVSTLGIKMVFIIGKMVKKIDRYSSFTFPTNDIIYLTILIFAVCLITPTIVYKYSSKKSVTERIREIE